MSTAVDLTRDVETVIGQTRGLQAIALWIARARPVLERLDEALALDHALEGKLREAGVLTGNVAWGDHEDTALEWLHQVADDLLSQALDAHAAQRSATC